MFLTRQRPGAPGSGPGACPVPDFRLIFLYQSSVAAPAPSSLRMPSGIALAFSSPFS